jgi:hypothetical protein
MQELKENKPTIANPNRNHATVAAVINPYQVAINKGALDGITFGQRFTIYELSEQDIMDPTTKESLGKLETIKGTGKVVHIQEKLSILEAVPDNPFVAIFGESPRIAFKGPPKVGDKARPI